MWPEENLQVNVISAMFFLENNYCIANNFFFFGGGGGGGHELRLPVIVVIKIN